MATAPSKEEREEYRKECVNIDGKSIHKDVIKRALAIAKLVEELHGYMGHRYVDPPVF
jgi:hypothetical protein